MKISIEGYKSIAERRTIDIAGLTILAGANSSGKSSFMQPLLLIKQTLENDFDAGALLLDGPNVRLSDSSEIISRVPGSEREVFCVNLQDEQQETEVVYKFEALRGISVDSLYQRSRFLPNGIRLQFGASSVEIGHALIKSGGNYAPNWLFGQNSEYAIVRDRCFLHAMVKGASSSIPAIEQFSPNRHLGVFTKNLIHIPGLRGNPERTYKSAASTGNPSFPGSFEKYIASIIYHWQSDPAQQGKFAQLQISLQQLGLASAVKAQRLNDSRLELRISRQIKATGDGHDLVNIADVGFGVSQVLPVLVALITAMPDQLVYIEQPELHLHPRAQYALAKLMADAINQRNIRLVIETHSSILIRGVQILVAQGQLAPEAVSLNWFTQNPDTGQADVSSAVLDKLGSFGDWPEDFDAVTLDVERMYLDAVEQALEHEV